MGPTGGRQSEQAYDEAGEENWEGVPLYRRPWFILTVAAVAAVLLFVLAFLFWWGSRTAGEAESDSSSPSIPGWSEGGTSASSTSVSSSSGTQEGTTEGTGHTIATTTTTTVQQTTSTTTTTVPSVPTTPKPPSNPEIPGSGIIPQAEHAILFNATENRVIYGYGYDERCYPASLTKLMTAVVALKYGNPDDVITATSNVNITESGAVLCGLKEGDRLTLNQALHALLMKSANDAAVAIAEHIGGSVEAFAEMMNEEARAIGATNSHFVNPHGLSEEGQLSTAADMALIAEEALDNETVREISGTVEHTIPATNVSGERELNNFNVFLYGKEIEINIPEI